MSHGCTGTTRKQKHSRRNGSILSPLGRIKRDRCEAKSRWCCVLWYPWNCASRIRTGRTNSDKRVLRVSTSSPPTPWCSSAQKTRPLDGEKLAVASWQCSSTFIAHHPVFLGETWNSRPSPTSLLSRHGSLRLLVFSEIKDDIERIPFWE